MRLAARRHVPMADAGSGSAPNDIQTTNPSFYFVMR
jgi:hypothetical protein